MLPSSGPISLSAVQTEFGGATPVSLSEYYKMGLYVSSDGSGKIPTTGTNKLSNYAGTQLATSSLQYTIAITDTAYSYGYEPFNTAPLTVQSGMILSWYQYGQYGSLDGNYTTGVLRDTVGMDDQDGIRMHPSRRVPQAASAWYRRRVPLAPVAGKTIAQWLIAIDGSYGAVGNYTLWLKDVQVLNADGSVYSTVLSSSVAPNTTANGASSYYRTATCVSKAIVQK